MKAARLEANYPAGTELKIVVLCCCYLVFYVGLVKAARLEANYPAGTELKIVVHHRGCPEPVNFTASVQSELTQIVAKVLVGKLSAH